MTPPPPSANLGAEVGVLLVLASGCTDAPAPTAPPTEWEWSPDPAPVELLDGAALGTATDEVIERIVATRPVIVPDVLDAMSAHVDASCPEVESAAQDVFHGDCTTEEGWSWYGTGAVSRIEDLHIVLGDIDAWHRVWDFTTGNLQVVGPDGARAEMLGYSWYRDYDDDDGVRAIALEMWGEFATEGFDEWADTWIADRVAVELYVDLAQRDMGNEGTWNGGMSRLDGVAWAFMMDDLVFGECPDEPTGRLDLQDQAGTWYTIQFDGDCDGCGVTADGTEVCADFTPLTVWSESPWSG